MVNQFYENHFIRELLGNQFLKETTLGHCLHKRSCRGVVQISFLDILAKFWENTFGKACCLEESCTSPERKTIIYFISWRGMTLRVWNYQIMVRKDHPLHLTVLSDLVPKTKAIPLCPDTLFSLHQRWAPYLCNVFCVWRTEQAAAVGAAGS